MGRQSSKVQSGADIIIKRLVTEKFRNIRITAWTQAADLWKLLGTSGEEHSRKVEDNIGDILRQCDPEELIPPKAILALSIAAAIHDGAKIFANKNHGANMSEMLRSNEMIKRVLIGPFYELTPCLADIIEVHDSGLIESIQETRLVQGPPQLQMRPIVALFRLADMLDTTSGRCCWMIDALKQTPAVGKQLARLSIHGWEIDRGNDIIWIEANLDTAEKKKAAEDAIRMMNAAVTDEQKRHLEKFLVNVGSKRLVLAFPTRFALKGSLSTSSSDRLTGATVPTEKKHGAMKLQLQVRGKDVPPKLISPIPNDTKYAHQPKATFARPQFESFLRLIMERVEFQDRVRQILKKLANDLHADCARLFMRLGPKNVHMVEAEFNTKQFSESKDLPAGKGLVGWVILRRAAACWPSLKPSSSSSPEYVSTDEAAAREVVVPVLIEDASVGAILVDWSKEAIETGETQWSNRLFQEKKTLIHDVAMLVAEELIWRYEHNRLSLICDELIEHCVTNTESIRGYIALWTEEGGLDYFPYGQGIEKFLNLYPTEGICGAALRTGQIQNIPDLSAEPRAIVSDPEVLAELVIPIVKNDVVIGIINVEKGNEQYGDEAKPILCAAAETLAEESDISLTKVIKSSFDAFVHGGSLSERQILSCLKKVSTITLREELGPPSLHPIVREPDESELAVGWRPSDKRLLPLRINGRPFRILELKYPSDALLGKSTLDSIRSSVTSAAQAVARRRVIDRHEDLARLLAYISQVDASRVVAARILKNVVERLNDLLEGSHTTLFWLSPSDRDLIIPGVSTSREVYTADKSVIGYSKRGTDQGTTGYAFREKRMVRIPNVKNKAAMSEFDSSLIWRGLISETKAEEVLEAHARSIMACPILDKQKRNCLGVIRAYIEGAQTKPSFNEVDESMLQAVAQAISPLVSKVLERGESPLIKLTYADKRGKATINDQPAEPPRPKVFQSQMPPRLAGYTFPDERCRDARDRDSLLSIRIETGLKCNLSCIYCCNNSGAEGQDHISQSKRMDLIKEAQQLGAESVVFIGGGEFLCHEDREKYLKYTASLGMVPVVFTNGIAISRGTAELLYGTKSTVILKLDSLIPKTQDDLAGRKKGGYSKYFRIALDNLMAAGYDQDVNPLELRLGASCVVTKYNLYDIPDVWRFCRNNGLFPNIEWLVPNGRANNRDDLAVSTVDIEKLRNELWEIDSSRYGYDWFKYTPRMGAGCLQFMYSLYITHDGWIRPCASLQYQPRNIQDVSLEKAMKSELYQTVRHVDKHLSGKCGRCEFHYHCCGCRGLTYTVKKQEGYDDEAAICAEDPSCTKPA